MIQQVESICRRFLWTGLINPSMKAPVAWVDVCKPLNAGGLGLKNFDIINKALILRHVWDVATKEDSPWVKWIHGIYLKRSSFWSVEPKNSQSWCFRRLLKLRVLAVRSMEAFSGTSFSFRTCYAVLVNHHESVWWSKILWTRLTSPKHSFIAWLSCMGRLATRSNVIKWCPGVDTACSLCRQYMETTPHLFFECPFSQKIWEDVCTFNGWMLPHKWEDLLNNCLKYLRKDVLSCAIKASWCATVYHIWKERKNLLFRDQQQEAYRIVKERVFHLKVRYATITRVRSSHSAITWCNRVRIFPLFLSRKTISR